MKKSGWDWFSRLVSVRLSWLILVFGLLAGGAILAATPPAESSAGPNGLPAAADSAKVAERLKEFSDSGTVPIIAVVTRKDDAALGILDQKSVAGVAKRLLDTKRDVEDPPAIPGRPNYFVSEDGKAAITTVLISSKLAGFELTNMVDKLRAAARDGLEPELTVQITGGPAFGADIANAFKGADFALLGATALVVALLLLITYRSPILWLVPLIVVGLADRIAAVVGIFVAHWLGLSLDGSTTGITSVLVFGAGTNYALLIVSRYREELRVEADHRKALARAVRQAGPAVFASNITVVLAVAALLLAVTPSNQILGLASAVGLLVALVGVLLLLPPALSLTGRKLFWPFIPRVGEGKPVERSAWYRVANVVRRRPVITLLATVPVLALFVAGFFTVRIGLAQTEQFRVVAESAKGFDTLADHFPGGLSNPTTVVAKTDQADAVTAAIKGVSGVVETQATGKSDTGLTRWRVVLDAEPASEKAFELVRSLRAAVSGVSGADALVGGLDAQQLDARQAISRDEGLVIPVILGLIMLVLILLLRALVAPILLISATILSAFGALGAGAWLSVYVLGFPGLDRSVPLFAFLFLVALGVDYTIFLVARAREETPEFGTREGIVRAVALTGGVITSAGIVLAAVFAVLGVLPLITLTQIGIVVGVGVLLDTFLVRTIVIPALFALFGRSVWWPGPLSRRKTGRHEAPVVEEEPAYSI